MQVELLRSLEGHDELGRHWNDLVFHTEHPEVFFSYEWALAVERAFSSDLEPLVFVFTDQESVIGVAALARQRGYPARATFLGGHTADYCDVVSAPPVRGKVTEALCAELERLGVTDIVLENLPADSETYRSLSSGGRSGYHFTSRALYVCPQIVLGTGEQRSELKETVKHKRIARMRKDGTVEVVHIREQEEAQATLQRIILAHLSRFFFDGRLSPLLESERRVFLSELASLLVPQGWLDITELRLAEQALAWHFGFRFQRKLSHYLPTFDVDKASLSPGAVLLRLTIQEECDKNELDVIDFGLGNEAYKSWFSNATRETRLVQMSSSLSRHAANVTVQRVASSLKQRPRLDSRLRAGRAAVAGVCRRLRERGPYNFGKSILKRIALPLKPTALAFYEWQAGATRPMPEGMSIGTLSWERLARTAFQNADDQATLEYLLRAATRLRTAETSGSHGFALLSGDGLVLHVCWTVPYGGFTIGELSHTLDTPAEEAVMLFDCWTPAFRRGKDHYGTAISAVAQDLARRGLHVWISSAVDNVASIRGIEKTGFEYRHTLVRRNAWSQRIHRIQSRKSRPQIR